MSVISMKQLLEAGVHFGHQTRRWNPKMKKYIFTERNGIYILTCKKRLKRWRKPTTTCGISLQTVVPSFLSARRNRHRILSGMKQPVQACFCEPALVGWHVDKLPDNPQAY